MSRVAAAVLFVAVAATACKRGAPAETVEPATGAEPTIEPVAPRVVEVERAPEPIAEPPPPAAEVRRPPRPGVERIEAWLDTKTVRRTVYAANTLAILDDFPFFVFQDGGLDPLRDIDYIHVTGPPYGAHGLEIVARHALKRDAMQGAFERAMAVEGFDVTWSGPVGATTPKSSDVVHPYDSFELVLPDKRHAVLTETRAVADKAVARLEAFRGKHAAVALALEFHGVSGWLPRADGLEVLLPHRVSLRVDASKSPKPNVAFEFANEEQAMVAVDYLKKDVKDFIDSRAEFRLTIASLFDAAQIDRKGKTVTIRVELTAEQANLLLTVAEGLVARTTPHDEARDTRRRELRKTAPPR